MGSIQSRNQNPNFVQSNVQIIITEPNDDDHQSDSEDEYFECSTTRADENGPDSHENASSLNECKFNADTHEVQDDIQIIANKEIESESDDSTAENKRRQQRELEEFREEISRKRALRQQCLKKLRDEMKDLNEKLAYQMMINEQLRESMDNSQASGTSMTELSTENKNLKVELAECQMYLQKLNGENLNMTMENQALRDHIRSLKEVNKAMKEMLSIRESQVDQLKAKLEEIELSFGDKEARILSTDLKQEYQRQLENIRNMRSLYEERSNLLLQENNVLKQQIGDKESDLQSEMEKTKNLEEYIATLESNLNVKNDDITTLENQLTQLRSDKSQTDSEMNAVNQLISQILFDFNSSGSNVNFDMLHTMLEQNRDFLKEMAMKEDYGGIDTGSFLPKMLYDIFLQANQNSNENAQKDDDKETYINTPEEIASKLPKVWRILIELLDHQNKLKEEEEKSIEKSVLEDCYKSVQTASGSQAVLSVSKTFIKLRDLIFEKRSLQKDTTRLKTLYSHLEQRLDKQEKKLSSVSLELTKTWHLVGKIKRQHRQLHTHEQILCYQLQQKRRVLNELKAELEYCRKKWALARAINKESEKQCEEMRHEFLLRKIQDQNSAESGYSDEHPSDGDECDKEPIRSESDRKKRFEKNLSEFYTTPLYLVDSNRRRSLELPILYKIITEQPTTSRAQSEPPACIENSELNEKLFSLPEPHYAQASCIEVAFKTLEDFNSEAVTVTLPPNVLIYKENEARPKIKNNLEKKKHKKKRNRGSESAEEMFYRLTASINGDNSTTTEENDEDYEEIEEIPLDIEEVAEIEKVEMISINPQDVHIELALDDCENKDVVESQLEIKEPTPPAACAEDDYLRNREARLARLEAETKEFYDKMTRDKQKRSELDNRLTNVHKNFLERQRDKADNKSNSEPSTSTNNDNENSKCDETKPESDNDSKES